MAIHESLNQRLVVRHHLGGLDRDELDSYLAHRLRLAGSEFAVVSTRPPSRPCSRPLAVCRARSTGSLITPSGRQLSTARTPSTTNTCNAPSTSCAPDRAPKGLP